MSLTENRYLLKVWTEPSEGEESPWRATLRDVRDGKVATFQNGEELISFLTSGLAPNELADDERS